MDYSLRFELCFLRAEIFGFFFFFFFLFDNAGCLYTQSSPNKSLASDLNTDIKEAPIFTGKKIIQDLKKNFDNMYTTYLRIDLTI